MAVLLFLPLQARGCPDSMRRLPPGWLQDHEWRRQSERWAYLSLFVDCVKRVGAGHVSVNRMLYWRVCVLCEGDDVKQRHLSIRTFKRFPHLLPYVNVGGILVALGAVRLHLLGIRSDILHFIANSV